MDPFSLTVGAMGLATAVKECLELARKFLGPSKHDSKNLISIMQSLYNFQGAMEIFSLFSKNIDGDDDQLECRKKLSLAIEKCGECLRKVKSFLQSDDIIRRYILGPRFDKDLKVSLKALDECKEVFMMSLHLDQHTIVNNVDRCLRRIEGGIQAMNQTLQSNEQNGTFQPGDQLESIQRWFGASIIDTGISGGCPVQIDSDFKADRCSWLPDHPGFQSWLVDSAIQRTVWLEGPPGTGKSFACWKAIKHVQQLQETVLYYFYSFQASPTALETAASLTYQLFEEYRKRDAVVVARVAKYTKSVRLSLATLQETVRILLDQRRNQEDLFRGNKSRRRRIFLFIDGVDEMLRKQPQDIEKVIDLFQDVGKDIFCDTRLWISSRELGSTYLRKYLQGSLRINFKTQAEAQVKDYLSKELYRLDLSSDDSVPQFGDQDILQLLTSRAKGSFLFAKIMINYMEDGVFSEDGLKENIAELIPEDVEGLYARVFGRYKSQNWMYVSMLFSVLTYAYRPLRLQEVYEAMTILDSDPSCRAMNARRVPKQLRKLFPPLVVEYGNPETPDDPFIVLCHAHVQQILEKNPRILGEDAADKGYLISPSYIADACLRYLSQSRYSTLFQEQSSTILKPGALSWTDARGHQFLTYSAKYWDKHLSSTNGTPEVRRIVAEFLNSSNFQTLLQVQSLCVEAQFSNYAVGGMQDELHFKRLFPRWLKRNRKDDYSMYREDYRHLFHEWGHLLRCGTCSDPECPYVDFQGQIDRALSGMLGPRNFMNSMAERFPSFLLCSREFVMGEAPHILAEGVSGDGSRMAIITGTISKQEDKDGEAKLEVWNLRTSERPELVVEHALDLPIDRDEGIDLEIVQVGEHDGTIRIGDKIFLRLQEDKYTNVIWPERKSAELISNAQECSIRDRVLVLGRRKKQSPGNGIPGILSSKNTSSRLYTSKNRPGKPDSSSECSDSESSEGDPQVMTSASSATSNSADETLSEDSEGSDDHVTDDDSELHVDAASDSESASTGDDQDEVIFTFKQSMIAMEDHYFGGMDDDSDQDSIGTSSSDEWYDQALWLLEQAESGTASGETGPHHASMAVFDISKGTANRTFHFDQDIPVMLDHSPPALHPTDPFVAWPLCGGDVLFADYAKNTYYVRKYIPSTQFTRVVSMKLCFSQCGSFLHIASLEAQDVQKTERTRGRNLNVEGKTPARPNRERTMALAVFVSSHRLSTSENLTRRPPKLSHRVKVKLGVFCWMSRKKLPVTFTWTKDHVYISCSSTVLTVFRVKLSKSAGNEAAVTTFERPTVLPLSAKHRQVFYYPPTLTDSHGLVLLGSYDGRHPDITIGLIPPKIVHNMVPAPYAIPPVGFFVNEDQDLGGWRPSNEEVTVENGFRDGRLLKRMEHFEDDDDCDLSDYTQEVRGRDWKNANEPPKAQLSVHPPPRIRTPQPTALILGSNKS